MCLGTIGRISRVWDEGGVPMAMVRSADGETPANLLYTPGARVDDDVLMQFGFVIEQLDRDRAEDALALRAGIDQERGG